MCDFEIVQVNEREMWVGKNQARLIEGDIIHVVTEGDQSIEIAKLQLEVNKRLTSLVKGKVKYLIDLNKCGKNSSEARDIWNSMNESEKAGKVAAYGIHPVAKVLASFVIKFSKRNDMRFFSTKEEAINWLNE